MKVLRLVIGLPIALSLLVIVASIQADLAQAQAVETVGQRTVRHLAGKVGGPGGYQAVVNVPPRDEYYLDYTILFRPGFDWIANGRPRGGKFPGLAGGTATGGCRPIDKAGWSARQTWGEGGTASLYLYHQARSNRCGDKYYYKLPNGGAFRFVTGKRYRVTQRVKVNAPNALNGEVQVWIDGTSVLNQKNLRLRGSVSASQGRVSMIKYHSYFGGDTKAFAPARDSYTEYGTMYVMSCVPNFSAQPGKCR